MGTRYEIRSTMNTPIYSFESRLAAEQELRKSQKRVGRALRLVEITTSEREITPETTR